MIKNCGVYKMNIDAKEWWANDAVPLVLKKLAMLRNDRMQAIQRAMKGKYYNLVYILDGYF